jgi:hypothetical protein
LQEKKDRIRAKKIAKAAKEAAAKAEADAAAEKTNVVATPEVVPQ